MMPFRSITIKPMYKQLKLSVTVVLLTALTQFANAQQNTNNSLTKYVDPLIGSAKHGHVFVGANVPYGAVQLGPNNIFEGWDWCSGYNYASNTITGFAHTHLSGTGIGDLGDISIMPTTGKLVLDKGQKDNLSNGYVSTFSHEKETAKAGYYSVWLDKYEIKAELTATERVGFHQYTFKKGAENPHLMLDLIEGIGWDAAVMSQVKLIDPQTIVGYRNSKGWSTDQRLFFVIKLSQPVKNIALYDGPLLKNGTDVTGKQLKAVVNFQAIQNDVLQIKVAISPVSVANAILNLNTELPGGILKAPSKKQTKNGRRNCKK